MYFVMDSDSNGTESCFFSSEEQADRAEAEACDNIRDCHSVAFVYYAVVEMSGKPADFDLVEEGHLCSDVLTLERVRLAHCTAIDAAHGQRFDISLRERLDEVATMIKGVMRDEQ